MNITEKDSQQPATPSNWPALLRGSVLSSAQSKHVQYISLADRRAQVIITINAFLIPLTLSGYAKPEIRLGIILFTLAAALRAPLKRGSLATRVAALHFFRFLFV